MSKRSNDRLFVDIMSASPEVTGSCLFCTIHYPDSKKNEHFVVDCGLFQEPEYVSYNYSLFFDPANVDYLMVTHNHIDHIGQIPYLVKKGLRCPIYTTFDTKALMPIALEDCYNVALQNCKKKKKKDTVSVQSKSAKSVRKAHALSGNKYSPMYNLDDIKKTEKLTVGCPYDTTFKLSKNVSVTFFKNAHLIGAALILFQVKFEEQQVNLLFTGDYGVKSTFFDPVVIPQWVWDLPSLSVVCESTYGSTDRKDVVPCFEKGLLDFIAKHPNDAQVLIPVISLERSQILQQQIRSMQDRGLIDPAMEVYLDGKLTIRYNTLFEGGLLTSADPEKLANFIPHNLKYVSKKNRGSLFANDTPKIVLASSGMGTFGPSQSHIKTLLPKPNGLIFFTCYCAVNTFGRKLLDSANEVAVNIGKESIVKRASVLFTRQYSSHAKRDELIALLQCFKHLVFVAVTHGESKVKTIFEQSVIDEVQPDYVGILSR